MTAEEQFLIDNFIEEESGFGIDSLHKVHRRLFIDILRKYASKQRTEGIREGFEAARENGKVFNGRLFRIALTYPTVEDYLNSKK